jgi:hypothetical protein
MCLGSANAVVDRPRLYDNAMARDAFVICLSVLRPGDALRVRARCGFECLIKPSRDYNRIGLQALAYTSAATERTSNHTIATWSQQAAFVFTKLANYIAAQQDPHLTKRQCTAHAADVKVVADVIRGNERSILLI